MGRGRNDKAQICLLKLYHCGHFISSEKYLLSTFCAHSIVLSVEEAFQVSRKKVYNYNAQKRLGSWPGTVRRKNAYPISSTRVGRNL